VSVEESFEGAGVECGLLQDRKCHACHGQFRKLLLELADLAFGRGGLAAERFGIMFVGLVFVHVRSTGVVLT